MQQFDESSLSPATTGSAWSENPYTQDSAAEHPAFNDHLLGQHVSPGAAESILATPDNTSNQYDDVRDTVTPVTDIFSPVGHPAPPTPADLSFTTADSVSLTTSDVQAGLDSQSSPDSTVGHLLRPEDYHTPEPSLVFGPDADTPFFNSMIAEYDFILTAF